MDRWTWFSLSGPKGRKALWSGAVALASPSTTSHAACSAVSAAHGAQQRHHPTPLRPAQGSCCLEHGPEHTVARIILATSASINIEVFPKLFMALVQL